MEISIVTMPANLDAKLQGKSADFPAVCKALGMESNDDWDQDWEGVPALYRDVFDPETVDKYEKDLAAQEIMKPGWEETETSFRRRVRAPGLFVRLRTMTLQKKRPQVKATVGPLKAGGKTKIQSLIFPKAQDWTMAKAKKWVSAHPNVLRAFETLIEYDIIADEEPEAKSVTGEIPPIGAYPAAPGVDLSKVAAVAGQLIRCIFTKKKGGDTNE